MDVARGVEPAPRATSFCLGQRGGRRAGPPPGAASLCGVPPSVPGPRVGRGRPGAWSRAPSRDCAAPRAPCPLGPWAGVAAPAAPCGCPPSSARPPLGPPRGGAGVVDVPVPTSRGKPTAAPLALNLISAPQISSRVLLLFGYLHYRSPTEFEHF